LVLVPLLVIVSVVELDPPVRTLPTLSVLPDSPGPESVCVAFAARINPVPVTFA